MIDSNLPMSRSATISYNKSWIIAIEGSVGALESKLTKWHEFKIWSFSVHYCKRLAKVLGHTWRIFQIVFEPQWIILHMDFRKTIQPRSNKIFLNLSWNSRRFHGVNYFTLKIGRRISAGRKTMSELDWKFFGAISSLLKILESGSLIVRRTLTASRRISSSSSFDSVLIDDSTRPIMSCL